MQKLSAVKPHRDPPQAPAPSASEKVPRESISIFESARPPGAQSLPLISRNVGTSADSSDTKLH